MSFNPLGNFNPIAPLDSVALVAGKTFELSLPNLSKGAQINRLYLHWAVEPFGCLDADYNAEVDLEDGKWVIKTTHNPLDNAFAYNKMATHTYHRNSYAFGLAITGMDGADVHDFGKDGVQLHELEFLAAAGAAVCIKYNIDSQGIVALGTTHLDNNSKIVNTKGEHNILTHAECAVIDAYPSERWDFGSLVALPIGVSLTDAMRSACGDALRARIHLYAAALRGK